MKFRFKKLTGATRLRIFWGFLAASLIGGWFLWDWSGNPMPHAWDVRPMEKSNLGFDGKFIYLTIRQSAHDFEFSLWRIRPEDSGFPGDSENPAD